MGGTTIASDSLILSVHGHLKLCVVLVLQICFPVAANRGPSFL